MPSSTEKVRCPRCDKIFTVDVETQYEGDSRVTAIKGEGEAMTYNTGVNYEPPSVIRDIASSLKRIRLRFDNFNLKVADLRVKKGMSDDFIQLYKMMGNFDWKIRDLITEAEIISRAYTKLIGE